MGDADPPDASPARAASVADPRGSEAFALLGNETRLAILLALWEAYEPFAEGTWDPTDGNAVSFSALREHIGMHDSGQFKYHLGKLEGVFVEQTAEGYQLLDAGDKVVRTLVEVAGFEDVSFEPTEIDIGCPFCGAPTAITYQHQRLYHLCIACDGRVTLGDKHPSGVLSALGWVNPASLSQREPERIFTAALTEGVFVLITSTGPVAPLVDGRVAASRARFAPGETGSSGGLVGVNETVNNAPER